MEANCADSKLNVKNVIWNIMKYNDEKVFFSFTVSKRIPKIWVRMWINNFQSLGTLRDLLRRHRKLGSVFNNPILRNLEWSNSFKNQFFVTIGAKSVFLHSKYIWNKILQYFPNSRFSRIFQLSKKY